MTSRLHDLPPSVPVGQLPPQAWLSHPATRAVADALMAEGTGIRFVGGCVRDSLLKRPLTDIDIATPDLPDTVLKLLRVAGIKATPTGLTHGTITATFDQRVFEITTLRTDAECFGRQARVVFTTDWLADAARRDFTFNALSCTSDGMVYDPFDGLADLSAGRVRFIGDAAKRIDEDILRLLRFFRFYAHYGRPPLDIEALAACRAAAPRLEELSGDHLRKELLKLLLGSDPAGVLLLMQGERVLPVILPEACDFGRLRQLCFLETRGVVRTDLQPDPLRRLAAVLPADEDAVAAVAARLCLTREERRRLTDLVCPPQPLAADPDESSLCRLLQEVGAEAGRDILLLHWAGVRATDPRGGSAETARWTARLDLAADWTEKVFPLQGRDLQALGIRPGPQMGALLRLAEQHWAGQEYRPDAAELLQFLRGRMEDRRA